MSSPDRPAAGGEPRVLTSMLRVPVEQVHPHPDNVRAHLGDLTELAASIRSNGLLQPLVVERRTGGGFTVIAGHRRLAAARRAGVPHVDVVLRRDTLPDERLRFMLVENVQRRDLSPLEQAQALASLREMGHSQEDIARQVGKSTAWVSARLQLLTLTPAEQAAMATGDLTVTEAQAVSRSRNAQTRTAAGGPAALERGWEPPHFTPRHPLAGRASQLCDARGHNLRRRVGNVACGQCWERAVRDDERAFPTAHHPDPTEETHPT